MVNPWPSHPYDLECRRATILNVYVYPGFRRKGIARRLMQTMIDWCRKESFAVVYLHASKDGKPLYEELGFEPTTEMRLKLRETM
jgi:GNAT superfamily N-acetyltransferase